MKSVGLIGCGAIGRKVVELIRRDGAAHGVALGAVLVKPARVAEVRALVAADTRVVTDVAALIAAAPDQIAECTGHGGLIAMGPEILRCGVGLSVISIGALADPLVERALRDAAERSGARLTLPAGAVGGLDVIAAARLGGLERVVYTARKKPLGWKGTKAESLVDLDKLTSATVFWRGKARQAAQDFPQNANVAAAIGLAGIGLDATEVELTADPMAPGNEHRIVAEGAFGRAQFVIQGRTLPDNPKTSMLAALSLARALLDVGQRVAVDA